MADTAEGRACAEALILARRRLRSHLNEVMDMVDRHDVPVARMSVDDVMSDLDDIEGLIDEEDATDGQ